MLHDDPSKAVLHEPIHQMTLGVTEIRDGQLSIGDATPGAL